MIISFQRKTAVPKFTHKSLSFLSKTVTCNIFSSSSDHLGFKEIFGLSSSALNVTEMKSISLFWLRYVAGNCIPCGIPDLFLFAFISLEKAENIKGKE